MIQRNTMKLWQMLVLAGLSLAIVISMFLPVVSIRGTKVMKTIQDAAMQMIDEKTFGLGSLLGGSNLKNDESMKKAADEFDETIEKAEEKMGIHFSSLSGIGFITMDTNALLLGEKDYEADDLEKVQDEEIFRKIKGAFTTFKILLAIVYFGAIVILTLTLLGFFLKWSKYIMSIISSVFGLAVLIIFAVFRWGIPSKLASFNGDVTDTFESVLDGTGMGFLGGSAEIVEMAVKSFWKAIVGMGVMTCFILGILLLVMGIVTCIVGKASVVSGGYSPISVDPVSVFPPVDPAPFPEVPPVFISPQPEPQPVAPAKPLKPKSGRVKCTQGVALGQGFKLPEDRKVIIGKSPQNATLVIHDQHISNVHCSIRYREETDSYIVKDHSTNGTFVHGVRLAKDVAMEYPAGTVLSLADGTNKVTLG